MESIDPEHLYDERGDVARSRPIFQGDVFKDVVLPGFGDEPRLVQVVAHPCSMREGTDLRPRITVAPVEKHSRVRGRGWNGNLRIMPLAELVDGEHYAASLLDVTGAPSEIPSFAKESAPVLWEMHQQRDWVEMVLDDESDWTIENLRAEEIAFDAWLRESQPPRRTQLKDDTTHTDLRRAAHRAAVARRDEVRQSRP
jgi:hypothetical protein